MLTTLNNGVKMPVLGLGVFRLDNEKEAVHSMLWALESGYRHIDTAAVYGNEAAVGKAIKESGIKREEIFITTKVWNEVQRTGIVQDAFEESLEKLGTDYVDLYLIHWPVKEKYVQTWHALEKIYEKGGAKAIGVSNFHEHHLEDIKKESNIVPAVDQIELHPYLSQKPLLEYCKQNGIQPEAWSPLGAAKNGLFDNPIIAGLAKKHGKSPAQIILRWNIECGIVTIPKSSNLERLKENLNIFDFSLDKEDVVAIDSLNKDERVGSSPENFTF